jgi:hypothetical protein
VVVQNQAYQPVAGASGTVTIHLPSGEDLVFPVTTDSDGIAVVSEIGFFNQPPGNLVPIDVQITYQELTDSTTTSFRIWR